jgi:hypothetical protein
MLTDKAKGERIRHHLNRISGDGYDWIVITGEVSGECEVLLGLDTTAQDPADFEPLGLSVDLALRFLPLLHASIGLGEEDEGGTLADFLVLMSDATTGECEAYVREHWHDDATEIG